MASDVQCIIVLYAIAFCNDYLPICITQYIDRASYRPERKEKTREI